MILAWAALSVVLSARVYPPLLGGWFDLFRFVLWLVVPAVIARFVVRASGASLGLGRGRLTMRDGGRLLLALALVTVLLAAGMGHPSVRGWYASTGQALARGGAPWFLRHLGYTLSWMLGWEFLLRGLVLNHAFPRRPALAAAVVVLLDVAAHVHKTPLECGALLLFAPLQIHLFRRWDSLAVPVLLHLWVECAYPLFLL